MLRNGVTLNVLRREVQIEAGLSTNSGHTVLSQERIDQMLRRTERLMADEDEWPNMHYEEEVTVSANTRFVTMPTSMNASGVDSVHVLYGDDWIPVTRGIGAVERSVYDEDQRATPINRWELRPPQAAQSATTLTTNTQFEVWPVGDVGQTLLFQGAKALGVFVDEGDVCSLDADVIVLRVAAEILARDNKQDAEFKMSLARKRTTDLLKRLGATQSKSISQVARPKRLPRSGIDYIPS